ncbi:hypothetical protein BKA65DRAFT_553138 [Rhexocercosporidium sp. MPI-PUGE-AT-0058]|nr:hypothetical protein BKA65DRAFT_553138 [Rhexocercosporidium sp. MPI-PUGE-AT-0058]
MRRILDVPSGVSIKDKIWSLLIEPENSMWISGVLNVLVSEFLFTSASPFEDETVWTEGLSYLAFSPEATATVLQDIRLRTLSSPPRNFSSRLSTRRDTFIREINAMLMPLAECNTDTNDFYAAIAKLACDLNARLETFGRMFERILPRTEGRFNGICQVLEWV